MGRSVLCVFGFPFRQGRFSQRNGSIGRALFSLLAIAVAAVHGASGGEPAAAQGNDAGPPKKRGWERDAISTGREAHHVVADHCSVPWATDENMTPGAHSNAEPGTGNHVTFSNCMSAEGAQRLHPQQG